MDLKAELEVELKVESEIELAAELEAESGGRMRSRFGSGNDHWPAAYTREPRPEDLSASRVALMAGSSSLSVGP